MSRTIPSHLLEEIYKIIHIENLSKVNKEYHRHFFFNREGLLEYLERPDDPISPKNFIRFNRVHQVGWHSFIYRKDYISNIKKGGQIAPLPLKYDFSLGGPHPDDVPPTAKIF